MPSPVDQPGTSPVLPQFLLGAALKRLPSNLFSGACSDFDTLTAVLRAWPRPTKPVPPALCLGDVGPESFVEIPGRGLRVVNWTCAGKGNPIAEVSWYLSRFCDFDISRDRQLLHAYYNQLSAIVPSLPNSLPFIEFEREVHRATVTAAQALAFSNATHSSGNAAYTPQTTQSVLPRLFERSRLLIKVRNLQVQRERERLAT
eukprot:TRINITY_DN17846_c0_g1_i1.p1 TRINITY_DN17846_c0_g1~~TRINITY_DN17846_c0_g1_i1.p1  ORF type:complete len:202 (+),score=20.81 TRINITY_DN17846_c0_g1_i1:722-1327(+)